MKTGKITKKTGKLTYNSSSISSSSSTSSSRRSCTQNDNTMDSLYIDRRTRDLAFTSRIVKILGEWSTKHSKGVIITNEAAQDLTLTALKIAKDYHHFSTNS